MKSSQLIEACLFVCLVSLCSHVSFGLESKHWKMIETQDLEETECPVDQKSFNRMTDSKINCLALCSEEADDVCSVASFVRATSECHGCGTIEVKGVSFIRNAVSLYHYLVTGPKGVKDHQLSESSTYSASDETFDNGASRARLDTWRTTTGSGGWVPHSSDAAPYIQVDFLGLRYIKGVVTQGRGPNADGYIYQQYTKLYKTSTSLDCANFMMIKNPNSTDKVFPGNSNSQGLVTRMLDEPIFARCVRIHPVKYYGDRFLRFDILGI